MKLHILLSPSLHCIKYKKKIRIHLLFSSWVACFLPWGYSSILFSNQVNLSEWRRYLSYFQCGYIRASFVSNIILIMWNFSGNYYFEFDLWFWTHAQRLCLLLPFPQMRTGTDTVSGGKPAEQLNSPAIQLDGLVRCIGLVGGPAYLYQPGSARSSQTASSNHDLFFTYVQHLLFIFFSGLIFVLNIMHLLYEQNMRVLKKSLLKTSGNHNLL